MDDILWLFVPLSRQRPRSKPLTSCPPPPLIPQPLQPEHARGRAGVPELPEQPDHHGHHQHPHAAGDDLRRRRSPARGPRPPERCEGVCAVRKDSMEDLKKTTTTTTHTHSRRQTEGRGRRRRRRRSGSWSSCGGGRPLLVMYCNDMDSQGGF